jgi:UDP-glucose 4-epimerase
MTSGTADETIVVTGASGLLGSRVVPLLCRSFPNSHIITITRHRDPAAAAGDGEALFGDLRDQRTWAQIPTGVTCIIHLAAVIPWKNEDRQRETVIADNVIPIENLLEASATFPRLKQIIYSSSVSVYSPSRSWLTESSPTEPSTLYGMAKLRGESLLADLDGEGVTVTSLRLSSLYAAGQYQGTVLPLMVNRARQRQPLLVFGDGARTQDFLHCEDAAGAVLLAFENRARGIYNVGTGTPVTMSELAQTVRRVFADGSLEIAFQSEKEEIDPGIKLDISKAVRELNFKPTISLEKGLQILKQELGNG